MRKIILIVIACIAAATFVSAFRSLNPPAVSRGASEIIETH
jgi:hypothetical protein